MKIRYIANTGFLIESKDKKILIDGIHSKNVNPYESVDENTLHKIVHGDPPFHNLDLLLFTHYHWDHFDPELTIKTLINNPGLKLFSSKQTVDYLKANAVYTDDLESRIYFDDLKFKESRSYNINGINFSAAFLSHDGEQYQDVANYTYLININEGKIFHCGDAKPNAFNYESIGLEKENIHIALLDFPYFSLTSGRKVVNEYIKPDKIIIMHLPTEENDSFNWLKTVKKVADRYADRLPEIVKLCIEPNEEIEII